MVVLGFAVFSFAVGAIFTRTGLNSFVGSDGEWSAMDRLMAWHAAIRMTLDHPVLGIGWGAFTDHCAEYGMDRIMIVHNTLLNVMVENGCLRPSRLCLAHADHFEATFFHRAVYQILS